MASAMSKETGEPYTELVGDLKTFKMTIDRSFVVFSQGSGIGDFVAQLLRVERLIGEVCPSHEIEGLRNALLPES